MADEQPKTRGMMAIKSRRIDAEWQTLVKMAAKEAGLGIGDFIVETVRERAQQIMKGRNQSESETAPEGIPISLPARPEDLADRFTEMVREELSRRDAEVAERMAGLAARLQRDQAEAARKMRRYAQRGRRR
jgi:hypothetical protein